MSEGNGQPEGIPEGAPVQTQCPACQRELMVQFPPIITFNNPKVSTIVVPHDYLVGCSCGAKFWIAINPKETKVMIALSPVPVPKEEKRILSLADMRREPPVM